MGQSWLQLSTGYKLPPSQFLGDLHDGHLTDRRSYQGAHTSYHMLGHNRLTALTVVQRLYPPLPTSAIRSKEGSRPAARAALLRQHQEGPLIRDRASIDTVALGSEVKGHTSPLQRHAPKSATETYREGMTPFVYGPVA